MTINPAILYVLISVPIVIGIKLLFDYIIAWRATKQTEGKARHEL